MIIWITGQPGSGKTTIAQKFARLFISPLMLDGDEVRQWLTTDCDFSDEGRKKHAERIYEIAKRTSIIGKPAIVSVMALPPGDVQMLVYVDGPPRRALWPDTIYIPPESYDIKISTW